MATPLPKLDSESTRGTEDQCHVASEADAKVCGNCGTHVDSLRSRNTEGEA